MNAEVLNNRLDKWLQRAAVTVMVSVGMTLVALGVLLYAPRQSDKAAAFEAAKVTTLPPSATAAAK